MCDAFSGYFLVQIWRARSKTDGSMKENMILGAYALSSFLTWMFDWLFFRFLLNPYLFLSSLALSTSTLENTLFLFSTFSACRGASPETSLAPFWPRSAGRISACLFSLAVLSYLSLSSILFALPLAMLLLEKPESSLASPRNVTFNPSKFMKLLLLFVTYLVMLGFICTLATGGTTWILKSSGTGLASVPTDS